MSFPRRAVLAALPAILMLGAGAALAEGPRRPNIIFILADDLGYADLGCYGQEKIKTPHLDRLAAEGIRFTQGYCGTSVCAPSRCVLMTGLHAGHAHIRANRGGGFEGEEPLPAGTFTVARMLQQAGYRTACMGKWGLGGPRSSGAPNRQGFDDFFGYTSHGQAHEYYPNHLWRNEQRVELDGKTYSHDLIVAESLRWIEAHRGRPIFLYLPLCIPHANLQVPDLGEYADKPWTEAAKTMAAMITRMDGDVGRIIERLKGLGLDQDTIVFFASDNGPDRGGTRAFFKASGSLRGSKRGMYEGGLRVPIIARWPGQVPAGRVSDEPWAFYDVLPTCADLAQAAIPDDVRTDGVSIVPALRGGAMPARDHFYWEIHEPWSSRAVRFGAIKAVRPSWDAPIELYDLAADPTESRDLAGTQPQSLARAEELFKASRTDSPLWPIIKRPPASKPAADSQRPGPPPVVGAIRWDAWHGEKGMPGLAVEKSLSPRHWHDRLPFFAKVLADERVEIRGDSPEVIEKEIEYAAMGGLDYWAFCWYPNSAPMNRALDLYLSSPRKDCIRFCLLLQSGHLAAKPWPQMVERLVSFMKEPNYQTVGNNRPLVYLYLSGPGGLPPKFGTDAEARAAFDGLREAARLTARGNPYLVMLSWTPAQAAEQARALGFDAIGGYATTGGGPGRQPYSALAEHTRQFWEKCRATELCVVPLVMSGWDRRPRIENPVPWETLDPKQTVETALHYTPPEPAELAALVRDAVQWTRGHPQANPERAILIYAWNELDEGGWLVPTLSEGDARLRALSHVLHGPTSRPKTASLR